MSKMKLKINPVLTKEDGRRNEQRLEYMLTDEYGVTFRGDNQQIKNVEIKNKTIYHNPVNRWFFDLKKKQQGLSYADVIKIMNKSLGVSISPITFSRKIRGESDFTSMEMLCLIDILKIDAEDIPFAFNLIPKEKISTEKILQKTLKYLNPCE